MHDWSQQKGLYIRQRALYICKRALYVLKTALHEEPSNDFLTLIRHRPNSDDSFFDMALYIGLFWGCTGLFCGCIGLSCVSSPVQVNTFAHIYIRMVSPASVAVQIKVISKAMINYMSIDVYGYESLYRALFRMYRALLRLLTRFRCSANQDDSRSQNTDPSQYIHLGCWYYTCKYEKVMSQSSRRCRIVDPTSQAERSDGAD